MQQKQLLVVGAIALALGAMARLTAAPVAAGATLFPNLWSNSSKTPYQWTSAWTVPAPHLSDMALAADGSTIAWLDEGGVIRRIQGENGQTAWETPAYTGLNRVAISSRGVVVAFSRSASRRSSVRLLDPNVGAERTSLFPLDGAIKTVRVTADGDEAIFGMGTARAYVVPMQNNAAWSGKPVQLPGIPAAVDTTTDENGHSTVVCGTEKGDLVAWNMEDGQIALWQDSSEVTRSVVDVQVSRDGSTAAVLTADSSRLNHYRISTWDVASGQRLWAEEFAGFTPRVRLSDSGSAIALNYAKLPVRPAPPSADVLERKVTLFARSGKRLFSERGSVSFSPELLAISPDGSCLTVRDISGNLWTWDRNGRTIARLRPPRDAKGRTLALRNSLVTPDGSALLLHYSGVEGDDYLSLYRCNNPTL